LIVKNSFISQLWSFQGARELAARPT
jgi:hypothetical protein